MSGNELITSAVALVTGNSIVDDLWEEYFPELEGISEVYRDILITAHVHAMTMKAMPKGNFIFEIMNITGLSEPNINSHINFLLEKKFVRQEKDNTDNRIKYLYPTDRAKKLLVEMGKSYASKMHLAISKIFGQEYVSK